MTDELRDPDKAVERLRELFEYRDGRLIRRMTTSPRWKAGDTAGTLNAIGYRQVRVDDRIWLEHRAIFAIVHGWVPKEIDHINRDRADNRIENLRPVTRSQNNLNASLRADNTSGFTGVHQNAGGKWVARIWRDGIKVHVGNFASKEEAIAARRAALTDEEASYAR